ncbi:hypothetical protein O3P69_018201 [Scylla paramamosain]|uniref:Dickkopf N-terminal cysteine-rich domain-containing protein n=1 Tax=Scylla paramamosain TaxID=85552 RepID=A0AAW0TIJ3_SCYPA
MYEVEEEEEEEEEVRPGNFKPSPFSPYARDTCRAQPGGLITIQQRVHPRRLVREARCEGGGKVFITCPPPVPDYPLSRTLNYPLLVLTPAFWTTRLFSLVTSHTVADDVLTWLLSHPLQNGAGGRHNARDLSAAKGSPSPSLYDPYQHFRLCNSDRACERREFCDQHYGVCREKLGTGQSCRRDSMCARDLDCMFGECQQRVEPGREGARCRRERDCGPDMCCARRNGEHICQRRLPLGHKCFVPEGGLEYAINERCPCQSGLICKYTSPKPPPSDPAMVWATYENMRISATDPAEERHQSQSDFAAGHAPHGKGSYGLTVGTHNAPGRRIANEVQMTAR